jgi:hypothetical protein
VWVEIRDISIALQWILKEHLALCQKVANPLTKVSRTVDDSVHIVLEVILATLETLGKFDFCSLFGDMANNLQRDPGLSRQSGENLGGPLFELAKFSSSRRKE